MKIIKKYKMWMLRCKKRHAFGQRLKAAYQKHWDRHSLKNINDTIEYLEKSLRDDQDNILAVVESLFELYCSNIEQHEDSKEVKRDIKRLKSVLKYWRLEVGGL